MQQVLNSCVGTRTVIVVTMTSLCPLCIRYERSLQNSSFNHTQMKHIYTSLKFKSRTNAQQVNSATVRILVLPMKRTRRQEHIAQNKQHNTKTIDVRENR